MRGNGPVPRGKTTGTGTLCWKGAKKLTAQRLRVWTLFVHLPCQSLAGGVTLARWPGTGLGLLILSVGVIPVTWEHETTYMTEKDALLPDLKLGLPKDKQQH